MTPRERLQERLLRDPGYISLSIRWIGFAIGLGIVVFGAAPDRNLQGAAWALFIAAVQLGFLTANPSWLRFELGKDPWSHGTILRPSADLLIALTTIYLTGGWNSPMYNFAVTVVLAPSLRYGLRGAFFAASAFTFGYFLTVSLIPGGFDAAYLPDGRPGSALISTPVTPLMIALFAAFLGEVLQRLRIERDRAEALAAAHERARLARDIHDGVAQTLFMLTMSLENGLVMAQKEGASKTAAHLDSLTPISRKALLELRNAMHNVETLASGEQSLPQAVSQLLRDYQSATGCHLELTEQPEFVPPPSKALTGLFRMIQETVTNACHHAQAQKVTVSLGHPEASAVSVIDDGRGFDPTTVKRGRGLENLKSRANDLGMSLELDTRQGEGTTAIIRWSVGG